MSNFDPTGGDSNGNWPYDRELAVGHLEIPNRILRKGWSTVDSNSTL